MMHYSEYYASFNLFQNKIKIINNHLVTVQGYTIGAKSSVLAKLHAVGVCSYYLASYTELGATICFIYQS